jgi:23S rRNA (cytidine1920-2'-O)/16S rRNA (cytidine1409-2'-O)-methyltransferase
MERNIFSTRSRARSAIMAGNVRVDGMMVDKPGTLVPLEAEIRVRDTLPFVSRGGLKLAHALKEFNLAVKDRIVVDIGASTGGFTDCVLQNGAKMVYAVDVGYGQLAWSLRQDPRVEVLERTNARKLSPSLFKAPPNFATIDVSFISLNKVFPVLRSFLLPQSPVVALIKPQFEAGRDKVGKKGVVRNPGVHREVIMQTMVAALGEDLQPKNLTFSPITGPEGNIEYLLLLTLSPGPSEVSSSQVDEIVNRAFLELRS